MTKSEKLYWGVMAGAVLVALCIELTPSVKKPVIPPAKQTASVAQKPRVQTPPLLGYVQRRLGELRAGLNDFNKRQAGFVVGRPIRPFEREALPARGVYRIVRGGIPSHPGYPSGGRVCQSAYGWYRC